MSRLSAFKCPSCNASLNYDGSSETIRCEFCNNTIIIPETMRAGAAKAGYMAQESPEKADTIHQVLELIHHGQKIEAIKLYRDTFNVGLKEAKDTVEVLTSGRPTAVFSSSTTTFTSPHVTQVGGRSTGCGCGIWLIALIIFFVVVVTSILPFASISSFADLPTSIDEIKTLYEGLPEISTNADNLFGSYNRSLIDDPIVATLGGDGLGADLILHNYAHGINGESSIMLTYLNSADGRRQIRWETAVTDISNNLSYNSTLDNRYIYLSSGKTVQALSRQDGAEIWRLNISDIVSKQCTGCLRSQDGVLVALTSDNVLYGIDTDNGRELWQVQLRRDSNRTASDGYLNYALSDDRVVVLDNSSSGMGSEFSINIYDLQTGALLHELLPECTDEDQFFSSATLDYYSQIFVDETSSNLYFLFGQNINGSYCLQQWDSESGTAVWQTRLPNSGTINSMLGGGILTDASRSPFFAFTADTLMLPVDYSGQTDGLALFNLANGELQLELTTEGYEVWPVGVSGATAVVWAEKQRGSKQIELWGIETDSGKRIWTHAIEAEYLYEADPFDERWTYHIVDNTLYILQLFAKPDPAKLLVQSINISSGALNYETENSLSDDHWQGITRADDRIYLAFRSLVEIDLATGQEVGSWPGGRFGN